VHSCRALAIGVLSATWIWLASNFLWFLFWGPLLATGGFAWIAARLMRDDSIAARAASLVISAVPVIWFWTVMEPDTKFGYVMHSFATYHLVILALFVWLMPSRVVR
jgi:hypothetical protein